MSQYNNANIYINRQADNQGLRESAYHESRENIYNKQKDLHRDIEIDVPELVQDNDDYPIEEQSDRESMNEVENVRKMDFIDSIFKRNQMCLQTSCKSIRWAKFTAHRGKLWQIRE